MKLSKATTFLALCAVSLLATYPSVVQGVPAVIPGVGEAPSSSHAAAATSHAAATTTTAAAETKTTTVDPVVPSTTAAAVTTTTTAAAKTTTANPKTTTAASAVPVASGTTSGAVSPTSSPVASNSNPCVNSSTCTGGFVCVQTSANVTTGVCQQVSSVCPMSPVTTCLTSADCPLAFSYCTLYNGQNMCTGTGVPGTSTQCTESSSGLMSTVKFAGIAVGTVAALGLAFALVRWQRRRQRSKMPAEMFGEIDYGMTDRGGAAGAPKSGESYPFSSRPNAHGSDHAPLPPNLAHEYNSGYDNNQYYEEPVGYTNNKMHQDQFYGNGNGNGQYDNQYYGNHKEGGGGYGGYEQHGGHGGGGGDGFYDNAGYEDYGHQIGAHASPIASPAAARSASPRHQNFNAMDNYGAEPSEVNFGGHGHGGGQPGYNGHY